MPPSPTCSSAASGIAWAVAAVITYALVWLTRGRREYVEVEVLREEKRPPR